MSRQFDVHSAIFSTDREAPPLVLNLQSDHLSLLRTVAAAPLWPTAIRQIAPPASTRIRFEGRDYFLSLSEMAAVRTSSLGPIVGNLSAERYRIVRAIDLLFTGV